MSRRRGSRRQCRQCVTGSERFVRFCVLKKSPQEGRYAPEAIGKTLDRRSFGKGLFVSWYLGCIQFAWSLPTALRVEGKQGKWVLRKLLDGYVPNKLTNRPKQGFGVPIGDWITSELRDWTESLLDERRLRDEGFFDAAAVRRVWEQHLAGWANHSSVLWSLVVFQSWNEARP